MRSHDPASLRGAPWLAAALLASFALLPLGVAQGAGRKAVGANRSAPAPTAAVANDPLARALAEQLERAAEHPDDPQIANDLGNLLALAGRATAAEAAYRHAIALAPDHAAAHYNLGRLLLDRGKRLAARRELTRAIALEPGNGSAHYYLGTIDDALGWRSKARKNYVRAFRLDPMLADPRHNPDIVGNRQALAAQLEIWSHEAPVGPSRIYDQAGRIAQQAQAPRELPAGGEPKGAAPATTPAEVPAAPTAPAGGFARSTGAPPAGPGGPAEQGATPMPPRPAFGTQRAPQPATAPPAAAPPPATTIIDNTTLSYGGGPMNQAQPSTGAPRGVAPVRPTPMPFVPQPGSTGQIQRSIVPPPAR